MSDEREWYADKGYVRGGFYDEMGGMLVGVRAQDIANRLNELAELREVFRYAKGLCAGEDWNGGTAALYYRKPLREAVEKAALQESSNE